MLKVIEIFRKDVNCDNIKSHKKPGFHPLFRRYIFWKTTGGVKLTLPSRFRVKYLIHNMIHQVIQIFHSSLELILKMYSFCMTFLYFSICRGYWDLIENHLYHSFFSVFHLKNWVAVYKEQMFYYFQNS